MCTILDPHIVLIGLGDVYNQVGEQNPTALFWMLVRNTPVTIFAYIIAAWFWCLALEKSKWFWIAVCLSPICGELAFDRITVLLNVNELF